MPLHRRAREALPVRPRNAVEQYDDLAHHWWRPDGEFAALHWLAEARAELIPEPQRPGAALLDLGCGGGLLAPHVRGYTHVGVDLSISALKIAAAHGLRPVGADAACLPFPDGAFDVVVAGEVLEHVTDLEGVVAEACRVLAAGGSLVVDTIADTAWARLSLVTFGEWLPGGPPPRCHDPELFVDPRRLQRLCARHGVRLRVRGLAPDPWQFLRFQLRPGRPVRLRPTRSLSGLYQGLGLKEGP